MVGGVQMMLSKVCWW